VIVCDDGSATPGWFPALETAVAGESGEDHPYGLRAASRRASPGGVS